MAERAEFVKRFYGADEGYQKAIDYERKVSMLTRLRNSVRTELSRAEQGGPGAPDEQVIVPSRGEAPPDVPLRFERPRPAPVIPQEKGPPPGTQQTQPPPQNAPAEGAPPGQNAPVEGIPPQQNPGPGEGQPQPEESPPPRG